LLRLAFGEEFMFKMLGFIKEFCFKPESPGFDIISLD
jgi:hypothetical protein